MSGFSVAKAEEVFHNVKRAVYFNRQNRGMDRMPSIAKKSFEKKVKNQVFRSFQKKEIEAERWFSKIRRKLRTAFEMEAMRNVVGYRIHGSILLGFEIKSA